MFQILNLDHIECKNRVVGVRIDINSPLIEGKIVENERISSAAKTIKELQKKGAKLVLLAHQGRKGKEDCVSLKNHLPFLEKAISSKVSFCEEIAFWKVQEEVQKLEEGEVLLLENLRFFDEEEDPTLKANKIATLSEIFDFYVQDAFSVAHRNHSSITQIRNIPLIAGRLMEKEVRGLNTIEETAKPHLFLFGGAKPDDLVELLEVALEKENVDLVLLTGVIGELALHLHGYYIGKKLDFMEEQGFVECAKRLKKLLETYPDKFMMPSDLAVLDGKKRKEIRIDELEKNKELLERELIQDIGTDTVSKYDKVLQSAGAIYVKGPAGNFELSPETEYGSREVMKAVVKSKAFSFMGGGHSVTAAKRYGVLDKFSYVSLAGGALVRFLSGKTLPGIQALEESFNFYEKKYEDFVVVGSNVLDTLVSVPNHFSEFVLGDKVKIDENFSQSVGGGGVNVSVTLSLLGAKVGYLGKISREGETPLKETLEKYKITLIPTEISDEPVAKSVILETKDADRIIFAYRGQNHHLKKTDILQEEFSSRNFYFSSLTNESFETQLSLAKQIKKEKYESSICYNPTSYLLREERKVKELIKLSDVLTLNYAEAQLLVGECSLSECLKKIKSYTQGVVVITNGAHGAYAYDGEKEYFQKSLAPQKIVDTTGAGDCFTGTFFYFYSHGYGIKRSLFYAAKNASSLIMKKGAQNGLLTYKELVKEK